MKKMLNGKEGCFDRYAGMRKRGFLSVTVALVLIKFGISPFPFLMAK